MSVFWENSEMKMLPGLVLALACFAATAAKADWQYTQWGMTPQQVVSASKNAAKQNADLHPDSDGNVSKLVAPYQSGKFPFEAQFGFDATDGLASVTLVLNDKSATMDMSAAADMKMDMSTDQGVCHDLQMNVNTEYGRPTGGGTADMLYSMETWQDQKSGNTVKYTVLYGTGCYVQYSAVKRPGAP